MSVRFRKSEACAALLKLSALRRRLLNQKNMTSEFLKDLDAVIEKLENYALRVEK